MYCPNCKIKYQDGLNVCTECESPLVEKLSPDPIIPKKSSALQVVGGIGTAIVVNLICTSPYFYFVLDILQRATNSYDIHSFHELTGSIYMIMIPISYIIILGLINYFLYKRFKLKPFFVSFMISSLIITSLFSMIFPSLLWL
jgi:site-specific recombinase